MRENLALLLVTALVAGLFCGCGPRGEEAPQLSAPAAMVSFDPDAVPGVTVPAPADLTTSGTSEIKTVSVLVGDYTCSYAARTLSGANAALCFTLSGVTPNAPAMLDIEEVHQRSDDPIAYSVFINGTEVYGRTYDPCSDGLNHCYFDIPAEVVGASDKITVRIVNKADTEVRFRRIWALSNPEETAGLAEKMDVVLMLSQQPDNLNYNYIRSVVDSYRSDGKYNVGLGWEIGYMQFGKERMEAYLDNVITASVQTGAPVYIGISSWWACTPDGMDGLGGMWHDARYQQVTYDATNSDGRGHWQLSTPNVFSNTPWLTMNNDYYNEVRAERIKETVEYLQLRTAELALAGQNLPPIHLYADNEPIYWPISWTEHEFDSYPLGVGDFSSYVIADAAADGITLDPTDGLDATETLWMYRNLNSYISQVGQAFADGLGYNYITVHDGVVTYPTEQMVMDSYTHSPIQYFYPNWDENQKAWENHVLESIHFGGEWNHWLDDNDSRSLDYLLAYGSFANINAERSGFPGGGNASTDFRVLSQCYAYGLEAVNIYNVLADSDAPYVKAEMEMGSTLLPTRYYASKPIFESNFSQKTGYSIGSVLVDIQNLRWDETAVMPSSTDGGLLVYRIRNAGQYGDGLLVSTQGSFSGEGRLELLVGTARDNMKSAGVYDAAQISALLDAALYAHSDEVYIGVRLYGEDMTTAQMAGLCLTKVGIYRGGVTNGRADGTQYTYDENRIRCQIIAARADTEQLMEKFLEKAGGTLTTELQKQLFAAAYTLYAAGCYGEAYDAISQGISQLLPASFTVSGYGQLGQYPVFVEVTGKSKVTVCLKEVSDSGIRFSISGSSDAQVTLSYLTKSGKWTMNREPNGDWVIAAGGTKAKDGKVSFTIDLKERKAAPLPTEFEARIQTSTGSMIRIRSQDRAVNNGNLSVELICTSSVKCYRGPDGTAKEDLTPCDVTDLRKGDYAQVKLNEKGTVAEVYAWYGAITGTVIKVEEMCLSGEVSNPFVTVQADDGTVKRLEIGADCKLRFTGATGELGKTALVDSVGLTVGQTITVTYCPYTVNDRTRAIEITD